MLNGITHDIHISHGNIVDMMLALDADMLVVGSRGLSGLAGLIRGSVSQALIGNAHDCSLIMITCMQ